MDTAWCYDTDNQASIGSAVRALPHVGRSELFITSKIPCCPSDYYSYGTQECARAGVDLNSTEKEIEANLKQIGVEYVDLLLMHWPCSKIEDTVAVYQAMELALGKGQTRAIGVSNFNASALEALKQKTTIKPAVTQNQYSIGNHFNSYAGNDDETLEFQEGRDHSVRLGAARARQRYRQQHLQQQRCSCRRREAREECRAGRPPLEHAAWSRACDGRRQSRAFDGGPGYLQLQALRRRDVGPCSDRQKDMMFGCLSTENDHMRS